MTLDNFVEADILSTCNALGCEIKGKYEKGPDCIECLKDILRYLRRDDDNHSILRYLGSINLLQNDLLPILKRYHKDKDIFDFTLRILVALTNPALLLYKEDIPDDKLSRNVYLQLIAYLQNYKKAFMDVDVWTVLKDHLKELLHMNPIERDSGENLIVERILILTRNILHIPSDESVLKRTDDDLSPQDKIVWNLHKSDMAILILYMASNSDEHKYCLHILEIIFLMLREYTPETLANSNPIRTTAEKEKDIQILEAVRIREQNIKLKKVQSLCASRFNGVYCVKNMKSISDKDYIAHRLITNMDEVKFDAQKNARRIPKNKVRAPDVNNTRHSILNIRMLLKEFCIQFLKGYNKMMVSVKRELLRKKSEEHDDTYYLWAVCYFMQFNRLYDFQPAFVSETISVQTFHHIQTQITNYQEMMLTDKKKILFWAKRTQLGVSAYKELLETLKKMEHSEDERIKGSADALISHVFYVIEYRELLLLLLNNYDEVKFPISYLAELVESAQLFLKMLENHSKKHSEVIVQKKRKKVRRRKKKPIVNEPVDEEKQLNDQWDILMSELPTVIQNMQHNPEFTPFDGASEMTFEEQKIEAVYKIREAMAANEPRKAVGLLRAARELWPEGDSFGSPNITPEDELNCLKEIHFSNLKKDPTENSVLENEGEEEEEDDEETEALSSITEQKLDLEDIYKRYASPKVVQPCSLLLANYRNNKPQTNACLIKLLHKIAWSCKMHALFFQSTIFLTFQKIFNDPDAKCDPIIKEFYRFAKFILNKFFEAAEKNDKIFVELLFWKGSREAYELEEGYGASENKIKGWTEDEEEELRYLYEENKDVYIEGQDVADIILANFNKSKTKQQIISALKRLDLIKNVKDLRPAQRKEWQEAEIIELQDLYEDYKNSDDVMGIILGKLSIKRSRKAVIDKLLELNLISDRKEVRKKSKNKNKNDDSDENSEEENNLSNNSETEIIDEHLNFESSDDENEKNFFKNLEKERLEDHDERSSHDFPNMREGENSETAKDLSIKKSKLNKSATNKLSKHPLPKIWEEQEIMELTSLFNENRENDDILHILKNSLTVKRPKQAIVEKLLELALIKNKNELKKKKIVKNRINKLKSHNNSDSDVDLMHSNNISNTDSKEKKLKRRILSDSDEDISLSSANMNSDNGQNIKKRKAKPWDEKEIVELSHLFLENKDSDDVLSIIVKRLSTKRSQKDVIEKLLEVRLIKDKKEVQKKNKKINDTVNKPTKNKESEFWQEQEMYQLSQLYHENKDSPNVLKNILDGLSIKRSRKSIIDKLLEVGLIKTKNELNQKAKEKSSKRNTNNQEPEFWQEQEIFELNKLYNENKDSGDVLDIILSSLSTKRPRKNVIEKLLEVGLIQNKNDLNKKKFHKNKEKNIKDSNLKKRTSSKVKNNLESSDDDDIPLSHITSSMNDNILHNHFSYHDSKDIESNFDSGLQSLHFDDSADKFPSQKIPSLKSSKRKRLQIDSDDSNDNDDFQIVTEKSDNLIIDENEQHGVTGNILELDDHPKARKKKLRILEDSDDSS